MWFSLADYLSQHHRKLSVRALSNYLYALHRGSARSPLVLDFSELFTQMELPLVERFAGEHSDP